MKTLTAKGGKFHYKFLEPNELTFLTKICKKTTFSNSFPYVVKK